MPTEIKRTQENFRPARHEDKVKPGLMDTGSLPPDSLGNEGKRIWLEYRDYLIQLGLLTRLDKESFYQLCESFDNIQLCREALQDAGDYLDVTCRGQSRHPLAQQRDQFVKENRVLLAKFGMNPSDRGGIEPKSQVVEEFPEKP